ncbi:MAG: hypothetical protein QOI80_2745, partial [Solirubrobacteraceae bacterium]|nr:hypothetical protein [Solirubrobacteraceae bacterium]
AAGEPRDAVRGSLLALLEGLRA